MGSQRRILARRGVSCGRDQPNRRRRCSDSRVSFGHIFSWRRRWPRKLAAMITMEFFLERRQRADMQAFERLMRRNDSEPPGPNDEIL